MLYLKFPEPKHELLWKNIIKEFELNGEKIIPYALALKTTDYNYSEYFAKTIAFRDGIDIPAHLVTSTTYFLFDDSENKILGAVNIRHRLNDSLLIHGGHIGYGVAPSERRKGYATKMLALALEKCKEMGISKVLITCDKKNTGSAKTIINNGGILENEITEENGNIVQRYWIELKKL